MGIFQKKGDNLLITIVIAKRSSLFTRWAGQGSGLISSIDPFFFFPHREFPV